MKHDFRPILIVPAIPYDRKIRFFHYKNQIDLAIEELEDAWNILRYCNGRNDLQTISELSALPFTTVQEFVSTLKKLELIDDSREQYLHFHKISNYPTPFSYNLTSNEISEYTCSPRKPVMNGKIMNFEKNKNSSLFSLRKKRRSCRNFSNKKLSIDQIGNICHYAYCISDHSVPSGGALYPLKIYVLISKDQEKISSGYYEYDAEQDNLVLFKRKIDIEQLKYCFNQEDLFFGAPVQIIIAADLRRQTYKYANRGYRLTLIEVGHAAENINLYCAEQGIGVCEMGGIQDEPLINELGLEDNNIYPILGISIGYPSDLINNYNSNRYSIIEKVVGDDKPVKRYWTESFDVNGAFFGATSIYENGNSNYQYAGATSSSYEGAVYKSVIEGYERWCSSQIQTNYYGPAKNLKNWLHPKLLVPLTKEQLTKCNVTEFNKCLPISWTLGKQRDGSEIYIPSDIVYYGHKAQTNTIYFGNSSGVAAFTNYKEAEKRALVELIERDALMRNWYSQDSPNIISIDALPIHVINRIIHWQKQKRKLYILELPSEYGWVIESIIISNEYPFFVSGAAATIDEVSIASTIHKSLQEAEYNLLLNIKYPSNITDMEPQKVSTPAEHGKIYHLEKYAKTLSWLWNGKVVDSLTKRIPLSFEELAEKLNIITINLSERNSNLSVVRVLSTKLVPINFGFYFAHYTHPEIKKLNPASLKMPHYFA